MKFLKQVCRIIIKDKMQPWDRWGIYLIKIASTPIIWLLINIIVLISRTGKFRRMLAVSKIRNKQMKYKKGASTPANNIKMRPAPY
jgi:hypothetical protein